MILDSSAIIAIVRREPGFEQLLSKIERASDPAIGTPTLAEAGVVLEAKLGLEARSVLERFLSDFGVAVVPFGEEHWREAVSAFRRFGRGRHVAGLNFGDCLAYAVARLADEPLLFVGNDFSETDLEAA